MTACSTILLPSQPASQLPPQPLVIKPSELEVILQNYEYVRKKPVTELVKELDKAKKNLSLAKSDTARVELALILVLPNTPFRDIGAAITLLNEPTKDVKSSPSMGSFKHLLSTQLSEQQRIHGNINELSQKLKEEQKHSEVLKNQIDNIKNMERNLILRDMPRVQ